MAIKKSNGIDREMIIIGRNRLIVKRMTIRLYV